jgi:hypothetical protein
MASQPWMRRGWLQLGPSASDRLENMSPHPLQK